MLDKKLYNDEALGADFEKPEFDEKIEDLVPSGSLVTFSCKY